ncbi:unnamed protein product, partial [Tetraodon nigroviridis]
MNAEDPNPAATPTPCEDIQGDGRWMSLHQRFVSDSKDKEPDVLFVGDSLIQLMHQFGIWRQLFSPLHALNFGVGGDATQHVLWRLSNGELDNISPKVNPGFVHSNGSISHQDMYDYLHLTPRGYQAVCEPLHAQLKSMLDEPSEN